MSNIEENKVAGPEESGIGEPKGKKDRRKIAMAALAAIIAGALMITAYFAFNGHFFVKTQDARVAADLVSVTPQMGGRVVDLTLSVGDTVNQGDIIGSIDTSSAIGSTDVNLQSLSQSAGVNAYKSGIVAPISGKIIQLGVKEGQTVSSGQTVAMIANTEDMYIAANIEETDIAGIEKGQMAEVTIDAIPGRKFVGEVDYIGEAANSVFSLVSSTSSNGNYTKVTQTIPIRIRFPELAGLGAKLGMNAEIKVHIN